MTPIARMVLSVTEMRSQVNRSLAGALEDVLCPYCGRHVAVREWRRGTCGSEECLQERFEEELAEDRYQRAREGW